MTDLTYSKEVLLLSNLLHIEITHFAKGIYSDGTNLFHTRSVNRLFLVTDAPDDDSNYIEDRKEKIILKKGMSIFVPASHSTKWMLTKDLSFISIHFKAEYIPYTDLFSTTEKLFVFRDPSIHETASGAFHSINSYSGAFLLSGLCRFISGKILETFTLQELSHAAGFGQFRKVATYVQENLTAKTLVSDLAEIMNMRRDVFSRTFHKETGLTPKEYLADVLIKKAADLLSKGKNCRETAKILQFNNEYYFSRFFRRMTGIPPSRYREKIW